MTDFTPGLRSLAAGSLPHINAEAACRLALSTLDVPTWPQLPRRSFLENMYVQFSELFPGVVVKNERIYVDRERDLDPELERLYIAYLMNDLEYAAISSEYAAGLYCFLDMDEDHPPIVKGQVTGPVSWGLMVADQNRNPVLYDDILAEAVAKHLRLKATWMEQQLRKLSPQTIIFVDEPYMSSFGSAFVSLNREQVITAMEEVFAGIEGLKGVHCCGNTDWSLLLSTTVDILNLDAYEYAEELALYPDEVSEFLGRGGIIAWGIVPASEQVHEETVDSLTERFHQALALLIDKGLHQDDLLSSALIMPSCGCGSLPVKTAERVLELTGELAAALQERYA
ncbi:MAG: methionine synthase [Anaerolineae bacterium]|jgi:methionine synthase II (cobalamin-independent)